MIQLDDILKKIDKLAPISQVAYKLMDVSENETRSLQEISRMISYDPIITANILKVVNSAYFGLKKNIESIQQAVVYLGLEQVVDIVFMVSSPRDMKTRQSGYGLDDGDLWKYSVSAAMISKKLAQMKELEDTQLVFTSALLKDIGKVILSQYVDDSYREINQMVVENGMSFREAEKQVLGIDHAELGGRVARAWNFSPKMKEIIQYHHEPQKSKTCAMETSIVYMADIICMMLGIGGGSDGLAYRFHQDVVKKLNITDADIVEIITGFSEKLNDVENLMGI